MNEPLSFARVKVRLTRSGQLYALVTTVLGGVAVNSGNNILSIGVAGLLALMIISGILAWWNLRGLSFGLILPDEIFAGRPCTAILTLANRKRFPPSYLLGCLSGGTEELAVEILPGEHARLLVRLLFPQRGRRPLGELVLLSPYPFGLVVRGGSFILPGTALVYPQPLRVDWRLIEKAERQGEEMSQPRSGVGGDYRGIRDYVPTDPLSHVHWKGWLRHRRLMTKEFEAEGSTPVTFSWETVPGPGIEERVGQLTWLVRTALRRGRAVGLSLPGMNIPPAVGPLHRRRLLEALALIGI